ncbi:MULTISPECIES: YlzJ-like family protein [unclassified Bacillus cereus group]|uniref:YlzJ-like family protein n=1 Tax=unclassified Bacillus cereus group TaxID=2750818 RepID=UPI001F5724B3|nr:MULTISPECIES: YlzJ-like family protein [unclassified Bacillus cereus group]
MILYTMMPEHLIYPSDYSQNEGQKVIHVSGVEMVVNLEKDQSYSIVRLLSTNPDHYLQYEPGQRISIS